MNVNSQSIVIMKSDLGDFPVLVLSNTSDANVFVAFWKQIYDYPKADRYLQELLKPEISVVKLEFLFTWKNGMSLSGPKKQSFLKQIAEHIDIISELRKEFNQEIFDATFGSLTTIWQTFLLHIIKPTAFPIYDQHVYRAHSFLLSGRAEQIPTNKTQKRDSYYNQYIPFFRKLEAVASDHNHIEIDKALWAFGKMLKQNPSLFNTGPNMK
jgi:hypothetical protein